MAWRGDVVSARWGCTREAAGVRRTIRLHDLRYWQATQLLDSGVPVPTVPASATSTGRMEGGGTRPTLETLEKLAGAVGSDLFVGVGANLAENRAIVKLVAQGHAVVAKAS